MIQYGLISSVDARCLEKTIDLICDDLCDGLIGEDINVTEIGIFDGQTARGIYEYITTCKIYSAFDMDCMSDNNFYYQCNYTAIDNNKDKAVLKPFPKCNLIIGDSHEVYNQLADESQHLIFVDGNHAVYHVIGDFHCYKDKVKAGGYIAFHDTGTHIEPFKDYQGSGSKDDPDNYIGVRRALGIIGLLSNEYKGWELVFDEADETDLAGGICVFRKTI